MINVIIMIIILIETNSKIKADHMVELEVIIGIIKILEVGTTLEMTGIEVNMIKVIEETLRRETAHMTEVEASIGIIEEDLVGIEEIVNLGIEED